MTDLLDDSLSLPSRLGVVAEVRDGEFCLELRPRAELLHHGALRASVIAFMIDVAAGIILDNDPDALDVDLGHVGAHAPAAGADLSLHPDHDPATRSSIGDGDGGSRGRRG